MRETILKRLKALETRRVEAGRPRKPMLPGWLLENLVGQGYKLNAHGELDLDLIEQHGAELKAAGLRP
jgi:hypothetical protein